MIQAYKMDKQVKDLEKDDFNRKKSNYTLSLKNKINESREKEKNNEMLEKYNKWAMTLGYEPPNKIIY